MEIFPSLISSDLLDLQKTLHALDAHVAGYHIDIMDNHFVPNLTWGPMFVKALGAATQKPLHIHLMATDPFSWLEKLQARKGDSFIFHYEAIEHKEKIQEGIESICAVGFKPGIAVSPKTKADVLFPFLKHLEVVLVMSVEPGFSGQTFMPEVLSKVTALAQYKKEHSLDFKLAMDGGINETNINQIAVLGVEQTCIASGIFNHKNHVEALKNLYKKCM